jgi:PAS domain S-box-containing protein
MGDRPRDAARPPENDDELIEFLEHAPVGLCWVDPGGRVLWTNRALLELLGYAEQECVGQPIAGFFIEPRAAANILSRLGRK